MCTILDRVYHTGPRVLYWTACTMLVRLVISKSIDCIVSTIDCMLTYICFINNLKIMLSLFTSSAILFLYYLLYNLYYDLFEDISSLQTYSFYFDTPHILSCRIHALHATCQHYTCYMLALYMEYQEMFLQDFLEISRNTSQ